MVVETERIGGIGEGLLHVLPHRDDGGGGAGGVVLPRNRRRVGAGRKIRMSTHRSVPEATSPHLAV
ncbi:MAG: hypothetical protein R2722_01990 [Tessaracoccus sp.]